MALPVAGRSMMPLFRPGDTIVVELPAAELRAGDVILFLAGGQSIAHRALDVPRQQPGGRHTSILRAKGDHLCACDAPVSPSQVLGKVVAIHSPWGAVQLDTPGSVAFGGCVAFLSRWQDGAWQWLRRLRRRVPWRDSSLQVRIPRRITRAAVSLPLSVLLSVWMGCRLAAVRVWRAPGQAPSPLPVRK